ncbi:ATP-dependent helicase [Thermosulfurimonas marina]|uniref:DNA 3'-5' helicase n=2 Tax=Thermosulfurimonas marina TaxID=2047767 RepID=A0A6H1WUW6_9BACT|nr:ATP-dependent helicase [Thermosulfurimonas marina]
MGRRRSYLEELNPAQLEAVRTLFGPVLVIAGAGSGKTRTLVYRVARLVEEGVPPERILLLTFTRKAAREMLRRASLLLGRSCERVSGGTFHSLSHQMLREYGRLIGFSPNFTVLDRGDAEDAINLLRSSLGLSEKGRRFPKKDTLAALFSKAVNQGRTLAKILEREYPHFFEYLPEIERLFLEYQRYKREHQLMDYDDLLLHWHRVLLEHSEVRAEISRRFEFIMVDEYQDTNWLQAEIVRLMAEGHGNVMVVGDDSQSIYAFRGANFRNILEFPRLFPGTRIIKLEENYRSTQPILDLANAVIERAREKYTKCLFTRRPGGQKPIRYRARDESDQSRFVAERILELREEGVPLSEIAVLFRAAFHSFDLELELARQDLPFVKYGGLKLIEAAHIKDVVAHLKILLNPFDFLSWHRVLLLLEGVGPRTAEKIITHLRASSDPLRALSSVPARPSYEKGLRRLTQTLEALRRISSVEERLEELIEYYRPLLERIYHDDYPKRERDLESLLSLAHRYQDLSEFLADLALEPPESAVADLEPETEKEDHIVLSTIHSAKGLEWHTVFVISLCEGRFPSAYAVASEEELEEERRLFYVAVTRAREGLYLCHPVTGYLPGEGRVILKPSRFLEELPSELWEEWREIPAEEAREEAASAGFRPGDLVWHPQFGEGEVREVLPAEKIRIYFLGHGEKTLHLKFARLERL